MNLKHVALYSKHHYKHSDDIFSDLKKCLVADGYSADIMSKEDVCRIIIRQVTRFIQKEILTVTGQLLEDFTWELIQSIHPKTCWKHGYYHKGHTWAYSKGDLLEKKEYNPDEASLHYFLSVLQGSTIIALDGLPSADKAVLPLKEIS